MSVPTNSPLSMVVAMAAVFSLSACSTTETNSSGGGVAPWKTTTEGIPVGRWKTVIEPKGSGMKVARATNVIVLRPDGTGYRETTWEYALPSNMSLSSGKFKGRKSLSWTDQKTVGTVKRVGEKLFMYGDPKAQSRIVRADPPGYTLKDYVTFGGANPDLWNDNYGDNAETGITIFEISGKDLIMTNSGDNNRWLYKWAGQ
jgi:hypothetical protein